MTELERGAVFALGNGSETTLLVLELLNDPHHGASSEAQLLSEGEIVEALSALEREGLVMVCQVDHREAVRDPGLNIPEYEEGRTEVIWWKLTIAGRRILEQECRRRGWP